MLNDLRMRVRAVLRRKRVESEMEEELRFDYEQRVEKYVRAGMTWEEAKRQARLEFGGAEGIKEECRDERGVQFFDTLAKDIRFGMRTLLRERGVTALCLLILALGMGASTGLYIVWRSALVFPYEFESSGRWVGILGAFNRQQTRVWLLSMPEYNDLRQLTDVFESVSVYRHIFFNLTDNGHPESFDVTAVSADSIRNVGMQPLLGRSFLRGEDGPGARKIVLIAYSLWQSRYQGDPNILGRKILMNGETYRVIGVMPPYFRLWGSELWIPLPDNYNDTDRSHRAYWVTAMLKKGVSQKQANARLAVLAHQWEQEYGGRVPEYSKAYLWTEDVMGYVTRQLRDAALVLLVAIVFLLIITCSNVTNILLARAIGRQREVAIRMAIGGGRLRITRQFLTESAVLSLASGALGVLIAAEGLPLVRRLVIDYVSDESRPFTFDFQAIAFVIGLSLVIGVLYGITPAIQACKTPITETLKQGSRSGSSRSGRWWRNALVVVQVGLALSVVAAAGLMTESYYRLSRSKLGFNPTNTLSAMISIPELSCPGIPQTQAFYRAVQKSVAALPGVETAGIVSSLPIEDRPDRRDFQVEGRPANGSNASGGAVCRFATPGYFGALGIPLIRGRVFTEEDKGGHPLVAVVNETLAREFWPNESAIGKRIALGEEYSERVPANTAAQNHATAAQRWITIVGVTSDTRQTQEWRGLVLPEIDLPYEQSPTPVRGVRLVVRSRQSDPQLAAEVRETVSRLDPSLPLGDTETMEQIVRDAYGTERLAVVLLTIFGVVALLIAAAGIYGLLSYNVSQQAHEIGVRLAVGALPGEVMGLVLRSGVRLVLAGIASGVVGGIFLTHLMTRMLYQVNASDPVMFGVAALVLLGVAVIACCVPARRASRVDPMVALRQE